MNYRMIRNGVLERGVVALLGLMLALPAAASINKSIKIAPGESSDGASSVNGSVTVGSGAVVTGDVGTVNGTIRIADNAQVEDASTVNGALRLGSGVSAGSLETVNGSIRAADNCQLDGSVEAVNGSINLGNGTRVSDGVANVNGTIELQGVDVGGNVETVNGDVELLQGSTLRGDLVIEKPSGWGWNNSKKRKPRVIIGPGSVVLGTIELEREVELYISEAAQVGGVSGAMSMDDAVRFSGQRP